MESNKVFYFGDFLINEQAVIEPAEGSSAKEISGDESQAGESQSEEEGVGELSVGDTVVCLRKGRKKEEFDKNKDPKEQQNIVSVKDIQRIEGDKFFFIDREGVEFTKTKEQILKKIEIEEENESFSHGIIKFSSFIK